MFGYPDETLSLVFDILLEKVLNFSSHLETITHSCLYFSMSDSVSRTSFFQQLFVADIAETVAWGTIPSFGKLCTILCMLVVVPRWPVTY